MKTKLLIIILSILAVGSITGGVILSVTSSNSGFSSNSSKDKLVVYDETYIVEFSVPNGWFKGSDEEFKEQSREYNYIMGFVKEEGEEYIYTTSDAGMVKLETMNSKESILSDLQSDVESASHIILSNGVENKKIDKYDVYYYIEDDYSDVEDLISITAYVFIDNTYCVNLSARVYQYKGYSENDLENFVFDIVKSLNVRKNNNEIPIKEPEAVCYNDEKVEGLKEDNLDYYYNIDTSKFDKSKFDGNINFFGVTVKNKITVAKLEKVGVTVENSTAKQDDYGNYHDTSPKFSINTSSDILNNDFQMSNQEDFIMISNFTGANDLQSDNAIVHLDSGWNLTGRNIYPKQFEVDDYNDITIDLVIEKLGNPTYVSGRNNTCIKSLYTYTTYYYVYDDVAFLYSFYNWDDLELASVFYYPIDVLDGTATPDSESTVIGNLQKTSEEYLNSLNK